MRRLLAIFLVLYPLTVFAQAYELEYRYRPYAVVNNRIVALQKEEGSPVASPFSSSKTRISYQVKGERAAARFASGATLMFVVQLEKGVDPDDVIKIVRGKEKGDKRRFSFFLTGQSRSDGYPVAFTIHRISEDVYEIRLPGRMEKGEYAFMPMSESSATGGGGVAGLARFVTFGID